MTGKRGQTLRISLLGSLLLASQFCTAQLLQHSEFGFGVGAFNYTGDLVRTYNILNSRPAGTVFYRSNISKVVSFRTALTGGKMAASDKRPIDSFAKQRAAAFSIYVLEASTVFEYHFLDWRDDKRRLRFTPYLFAGFSLFIISGNSAKNASYSNVQPAIPFGGGIKYVVNPKWYLAVELGIRKSFFDYLDNISDEDLSLKNYQYGNRYDNDNYFFTGITLTRTIYDIPCPINPYR
ncbi:MAG: outer membrane beta-barrel protein [Bacteroidia bacterium]|nr:outer membrane beta-barrel protein [Bacteroidia bacterium]